MARYPEQVSTLVAHEPPVAALLPDAAHWRTFTEEIRDIYRRDGVFPAMQKFGEGVGLGGPEPGAEPDPEAMQRMMGNLELFAGYTIPVITNYPPDLEALRTSSARVVVGVGDESTPDQLAYRSAIALATGLGIEPVVFPGAHGGFASHPETFAVRLHEVLSHS